MGHLRSGILALIFFAVCVSLLSSVKVLIGGNRNRPDYADPGLPAWTRRIRRPLTPPPAVSPDIVATLPMIDPQVSPQRRQAVPARLAWAEDAVDEWAPPRPSPRPAPLAVSIPRDSPEHQRGVLAGLAFKAQPGPDPFAALPGGREGHLSAAHRGNGECWEHFDFGMLELWDAQKADFCTPPTDGGGSSLVCRVQVDGHLPAPTAPHTMCDGVDIALDLSALTRSGCLVHRPGYKCDGEPVHYHYAPGAIGGACARQPRFQPSAFPRDHLMDVFSSWGGPGEGWTPARVSGLPVAGSGGGGGGAAGAAGADVTLLVTREKAEHANLFHATSDFLNAFFM